MSIHAWIDRSLYATCSICNKDFPWIGMGYKRKPRFDRKKFCSEACRVSEKNRRVLAHWHQNKDRYRPKHKEREAVES